MGKHKGDPRRDELIALVEALVANDFEGSYPAAFTAYDGDKDGRISWGELTKLLLDAGVGTRWTRRFYVEAIFQELDTDQDGFIERDEFKLSFQSGGDL